MHDSLYWLNLVISLFYASIVDYKEQNNLEFPFWSLISLGTNLKFDNSYYYYSIIQLYLLLQPNVSISSP